MGLQWHCGNGCTLLHVGKSGSLNSLLCLRWQLWDGANLLYVFDCSGAVLFKNFLSYCPFPCPLARKRRLLCFFWSVTVGFSGLPTSPAPSLGYMRQKENQGIHCCAIFWVIKSLTGLCSSLYHSGSSYVCFKYNIQRWGFFVIVVFVYLFIYFLALFSRRNRKKCVYSTSSLPLLIFEAAKETI